MTEEISEPAPPPPRRRRFVIAGIGVAVAAAAGTAGWLAWGPDGSAPEESSGAEVLAPPSYVPLPEVLVSLSDAPRVARLRLVLETSAAGTPEAPQRLGDELARWLATRSSSDLAGAAAPWLVRARTLALARVLFPQMDVRDVLIHSLVMQ